MSAGSVSIPLWIIATCAVVWTVRMVARDLLAWLAARYPYGGAPRWVKRYARVVSGVK